MMQIKELRKLAEYAAIAGGLSILGAGVSAPFVVTDHPAMLKYSIGFGIVGAAFIGTAKVLNDRLEKYHSNECYTRSAFR